MNRLQLFSETDIPETAKPTRPVSLKPTTRSTTTHSHSFFSPLHYEPNYAYPLVVWLHGTGDTHQQIKRVMPHISLRNYVAVAPLAPDASDDNLDQVWTQRGDVIVETFHRVQECVRLAQKKFHIHPSRVFVAGYESGGSMAIRLGLERPDLFAGVASMAGRFPCGNNPLANLGDIRKLPILIAHNRDSDQYTIDHLCAELRLVHTAGMSLTLRQYPSEHELNTQMLSDLDCWMMQNVTGVDLLDSSSEYLRHSDN